MLLLAAAAADQVLQVSHLGHCTLKWICIYVRKGGKEGGEGRDKRIDPGGGKGWREGERRHDRWEE